MAKPAPKPVPEGYHTVTPSLTCRDTRKAIDWYKKAFGAQERMVMPGPDGKVMHAEIQVGNSILMLADEMPEMGCTSPQRLGGTPVAFYVYVTDVDAAWKRAVDAGAEVKTPLADMFWGDRTGALADPFGYKWSLAQAKRVLTPQEIEQGSKEFFAQMADAGDGKP